LIGDLLGPIALFPGGCQLADAGPEFDIGRQDGHIELVDLVKFLTFGGGRPCHAGQFVVHAEKVLVGDRSVSQVLTLDGDALFGLDGLV
jgi:hypothetical protein